MSDNELLLAISQMMDEKFKTNLAPVYKRLDRIDERLDNLEVRMESLETRMDQIEVRMDSLEARMDSLETRMYRLETRMDQLEARMDNLETRMDNLETRMDQLEARMDSLETSVLHIELFQENKLVPRLNTIESYYVATSERYIKAADRFEAASLDITMMKKVITDHSDRIMELEKKIS